MKKVAFILYIFSAITFGQWDVKYDLDGNNVIGLGDFAELASHWLETAPLPEPEITWVSISDPGVNGHEAFVGEMSQYETTNAQYCLFLNAALSTGDIVVSGTYIIGANGSNSGDDFVGEGYYCLVGPGITTNGATNGGASGIIYSDGQFSVGSGFENRPVTYVSWYGAAAFCSYYGWRLPTEWEWQSVADYDGTYIYGCGVGISNSIANYYGSTHPDGTTDVGVFGIYGYDMADMAGNVWEWTSSLYNPAEGSRVIRGGSWYNYNAGCSVSSRMEFVPTVAGYALGFRVCRGLSSPDIEWVSISEPGFEGEMSRYETTNAQYAMYLNAALASGDIFVDGGYVKGVNGEFGGLNYYNLNGPGFSYDGVVNGGAARINYSGGVFTVDEGFENHPATYVSWYGAVAFCSYYGWYLPTGSQWQAAADYDGSYIYGCGIAISNSIVNCVGSVHPYGTTQVGAFGIYGYGMADMAGNVWEWTSSISGSSRILRGGSWDFGMNYCTVSYQNLAEPDSMYDCKGFRACR